jgi:Restriction endonuclease
MSEPRGMDQHRFREAVLERDGGECQYCGSEGERLNELRAHHTTPVSEGGAHTLENGVALCQKHHNAAHTLSEGSDVPVSVLRENDVPENIPTTPPLNSYTNIAVLNVFKDEYQLNPKLIREVTGLERQRVNEALGSLEDAGWIENRTRGLYQLVYDGEGYVDQRIVYKNDE